MSGRSWNTRQICCVTTLRHLSVQLWNFSVTLAKLHKAKREFRFMITTQQLFVFAKIIFFA